MNKIEFHKDADRVSAVVAFAKNGKPVSKAFDWIGVSGIEADVSLIFMAARKKALKFMSVNDAENSTCYIVEIMSQWDKNGKLIR